MWNRKVLVAYVWWLSASGKLTLSLKCLNSHMPSADVPFPARSMIQAFKLT